MTSKIAVRMLALVGLLLAVFVGFGASAAGAVEYGNHNYLGKLSADPPTGFPVSPAALDLSTGPAHLNVSVSVANLTQTSQTVSVQLSVHRILTYEGVDVSSRQPGQAGISFPVGAAAKTTQVLYGERHASTFTVPAGEGRTALTFAAAIADCGYYQLDVSSPRAPYTYLASGFTRALGCQPPPASTTVPTTTVPTTTVPTTVPTTTTAVARVLGEQVTQPVQPATLPVTGAATGFWLLAAAVFVATGLGLVGLSVRLSRR